MPELCGSSATFADKPYSYLPSGCRWRLRGLDRLVLPDKRVHSSLRCGEVAGFWLHL